MIINIDNCLYRVYPSGLGKEQTESGDISMLEFHICCEQFENSQKFIAPLKTFSHFRGDQALAVLISPFTYQNVQSKAYSLNCTKMANRLDSFVKIAVYMTKIR